METKMVEVLLGYELGEGKTCKAIREDVKPTLHKKWGKIDMSM